MSAEKSKKMQFTDPDGIVHERTRRVDQADPKYAILTRKDGGPWEHYRVTQNESELLNCINGLLGMGQFAVVASIELVDE